LKLKRLNAVSEMHLSSCDKSANKMPEDLRRAHDHNDEVLDRIYIGRRFRNDIERLKKLFDLYTQMTNNKKRNARHG